MRTKIIQMNFTAGEWCPRLFGRSDLSKYWNALETLENFVILPYGGVARRDGLHFVASQGLETRKARLIPFIFSTEQAYILEFGHEYIRFFMNHGQIIASDANTLVNLHMNGIDASQTFVESSDYSRVVTAHGNVQLDTSRAKFGSASGLFNYLTEDYLTIAASGDLSANIFTIEAFIYQDTLGGGVLASQKTDDDNYFMIGLYGDGSAAFIVTNTGVSQSVSAPASSLVTGRWQHIRVVGDGAAYYLFVDGELISWSAITQSMQDFTGDLHVGKGIFDGPWNYYTGWMDDFRLSDVARSTDDYTPPTEEVPLISEATAYELETPYIEEDLPTLSYFQSFDTMYIFHPKYAWRKLTRTGHAAWSLDVVDFTNGPFLEEKTDVIFTPSAITGDIDLTSNVDWFVSGHVGALLRLKNSEVWGYVKITAVTDAQTAEATVVETLGSTADSTAYQEGAWSTYRGFPSSGCFNEESLMALATDHQPQTVWASVKGDYENFEAGTEDDKAFIYTIPASNRILWPGHLQELVLGTADGVYKLSGGSDDYISPTNVRVRPGVAIGVKNLQPIAIANSLLFWQKGSRKLRELTYDQASYYYNALVAPDLAILADHIMEGGARYSAWQQEPNSILWTARHDGVVPTMTYMRAEDIVGWARQITDGEVESIASIPDPTDTYDEVWVTVKRESIEEPDDDDILFLRMDGPDGSTDFEDISDSGHVVTAHGSAEISTEQSKYGGSSGKFLSTGNAYLTIPDHADFHFSSNIFDIRMFIYPLTLPTSVLMSHEGAGGVYWQLDAANGAFRFLVKNGGTEQVLTSDIGVLTADTWHQVRVVGDGTNYYLFVDGDLLDSEAIDQQMPDGTIDLYIGAQFGPTSIYNGYIDNIRMSIAVGPIAPYDVPETNLVERRHVEYFDPNMMVDSGITYSGAPVAAVSGLDHLDGRLVDIVGDDVVYDQQYVLDGQVTLDPVASEIQVGLPYTSKLVTMKPIINSERGSSAGMPRNWAEAYVSVYETDGLTINGEEIDFRPAGLALGEPIPLLTDELKVEQLGWGDGRITLEHSRPRPCTILGIFGTLEIGD